MANKQPLKLVAVTGTRSPPNLGKHGRSLWDRVMNEYDVRDTAGIEILTQACLSLDTAEECAASIRRDGLMIRGKNGLRDNPLIKHELSARSFVVRLLVKLGLDVEPVRPVVGRPPRSLSWEG